MHIALFHERFVFRFGVDRVLLCLAKEFRSLGHTVTLVGQQFDDCWSNDTFDATVRLPSFENYAESDLRAAIWLQENWQKVLGNEPTLDLALVGGWPFFQTIALLKSKGIKTWYQDHGIAPEDGFSEGHQRTIALLRDLKKEFVQLADGITPVSRFIARSQSFAVARPGQPVVVVRNGTDHARPSALTSVHHPLKQNAVRNSVFSIGRFEPGCYKQSEQVFDFARKLKAQGLQFFIHVLAASDISIPQDLHDFIKPTGFISDEEMFYRMSNSDICVCFSRWEGFNLGLAESQALGTLCLVYDAGAHAEVVADPWALCRSIEEFAAKTAAVFKGDLPSSLLDGSVLQGYASSRTWREAAVNLLRAATEQSPVDAPGTFFTRQNAILIEVGNASRDPANSGVVRVTRQLANQLSSFWDPVFVCWDESQQDLRFPTPQEVETLASYGGPVVSAWQPLSASLKDPALVWDYFGTSQQLAGWLILPEIKPPAAIRHMCSQAQRWGLNTAAIFYDAIAVVRPDLVRDAKYRDPHLQYMLALAECDIVIPISRASEKDLLMIWSEHGRCGNSRPVLLPGAFRGQRPALNQDVTNGSIVLCVSTVEPRKNHRQLIEAFLLHKSRTPSSNLRLVLVGNRYTGAEDLASYVENVAESHPDIEWKGIVSDEELQELYRRSAFTIYPSEIEGFGLPILESLWYGVPCLCHNGGVMAELAKDGGCLTVDVTNLENFALAITRLDEDLNCRLSLAGQASEREIKAWDHYAYEFVGTLCLARNIDRHDHESFEQSTDSQQLQEATSNTWTELLYPGCLHSGWQMSESEKAGLLALVQSHRPQLAIEIGTYKGGSLSLIRQHADRVISIDIDPSVAERFSYMDNVTFLTGASHALLPLLLAELQARSVSPDFVLIDGDHSSAGVKRDIECILQIVPDRTCLVVLHDMANRDCRRGALSVEWQRFLHVHHVDLDFVPGRLVENGSSFDGQVWGGLGLIVLHPERRQTDLGNLESSSRNLAVLWQFESKLS